MTPDARSVVEHARNGQLEAIQLLRDAGRELGGVLASLVNFFNPEVLVVGGDLVLADEHVMAGIREVIYKRSPPLATRDLRITKSSLGENAGVLGAATMVIEYVLDPEKVDALVGV